MLKNRDRVVLKKKNLLRYSSPIESVKFNSYVFSHSVVSNHL